MGRNYPGRCGTVQLRWQSPWSGCSWSCSRWAGWRFGSGLFWLEIISTGRPSSVS